MEVQAVAKLQVLLQKLGYRVAVTGRYDNFTRDAITDIQLRLHITPDGEPSPNTVQAMIEAANPVRMGKPQVVAGSYTASDAPTANLPKPLGVSRM